MRSEGVGNDTASGFSAVCPRNFYKRLALFLKISLDSAEM